MEDDKETKDHDEDTAMEVDENDEKSDKENSENTSENDTDENREKEEKMDTSEQDGKPNEQLGLNPKVNLHATSNFFYNPNPNTTM